jgi:hypothetical protein
MNITKREACLIKGILLLILMSGWVLVFSPMLKHKQPTMTITYPASPVWKTVDPGRVTMQIARDGKITIFFDKGSFELWPDGSGHEFGEVNMNEAAEKFMKAVEQLRKQEVKRLLKETNS